MRARENLSGRNLSMGSLPLTVRGSCRVPDDWGCIARASHTPVSFCRHARVTGVRFHVRSRLHELTVARPLILMRSEPGLRILRHSCSVG